jgi:hypothetical protein
MNWVDSAISPAPLGPSMRETEMLFSPSAPKDASRAIEAKAAPAANSLPAAERSRAGIEHGQPPASARGYPWVRPR